MLLLLLLSMLIRLSTQQCLSASDSMRDLSTDILQSLQQSDLQFSIDLMRTVASQHPDTNIFLSPSGVFKAMLLAYFISANQTEKILKKTLRLDDNKDKLDIYGAYYLEKYYQKLGSIKQNGSKLNSINSLFIAKDIKIEPCMKVLFTNEIIPSNFAQNPIGVIKKINKWVAWQTDNFIKDFVSDDSFSRDTRLVLMNVAYFKGVWKNQFSESFTWEGKFYLADGNIVKTTMMTQENKFRKRIDKKLGFDVLELQYEGDTVSMFLLLPLNDNTTAIPSLINQLDAETLKDTLSSTAAVKPMTVTVTMPKFTLEQSLDLTPILEKMGVENLFDTSADFSTLSKSANDLVFSDAIHAAKIRVDEQGTEAAGATALIVSRIAGESFIADQPFIYTLWHKKFNTVLFFGIFYSPPPK